MEAIVVIILQIFSFHKAALLAVEDLGRPSY